MSLKLVLWSSLGIVGIVLLAFAGWIVTLPMPGHSPQPPIAAEETRATLAALKPPKRERPLIAIVGINDATETTDYLMPLGILRRADVADVVSLATEPGPVKLFPALTVHPDATIAAFDERHPDGADYVIVPAMSRDNDPAALAWIRSQAAKGATIIGVCVGATVVGSAGLLDGKRATSHWFALRQLRKDSPTLVYVPDRRFVVDRGIATTTGISASMPTMLTLIEAIAGRDRAEAVAATLGLTTWDARHDSSAFRLTRPFVTTVLGNVLAFWRREERGIALSPDMDEVSLALVADAWTRTYRSRAITYAGSSEPVVTQNGVRVVPDRVAAEIPDQLPPSAIDGKPPAKALDEVLASIASRYGARTAGVVAMQLEYPHSDSEQ